MNSPELQSILLGIIEVQPLDSLLRSLAVAARELTGADYAAIGAYDEARRLEHFEATGLSDAERRALPHAPHGIGLLGEFAIDSRTVQLADFHEHGAAVEPPPGHPAMQAFLGVPLMFAGRALGAFYVARRPGGRPFGVEDRAQLESLAPYAAIAIHNARALAHEQQQRAAAEALADVTGALQQAERPEAVAEALLSAAARLLPPASEAVVCWWLPTNEPRAVATAEPSRLAPHVLSLVGSGLPPGRHERPALMPEADVTVYAGDLPNGGQLVLGVSLPLHAGDSWQLALRALHRIGLAGYAHLAQREAEAALERYAVRDEIARDLHDDIIQAIYAVGLGLHRARVRDTVSKDEALDRAMADLNAVIADLRAYIGQLSGDEMPAGDLLSARLHAIFDAPTATAWNVTIDLGNEPLGPSLERSLYLIARELISNVERHAQAEHASLLLRRDRDAIRIEVRDDGMGFDRNAVRPDKVGVRSVEQRAGDLDGSLIFETAPGQGTHVSVHIPLRRAGSIAS